MISNWSFMWRECVSPKHPVLIEEAYSWRHHEVEEVYCHMAQYKHKCIVIILSCACSSRSPLWNSSYIVTVHDIVCIFPFSFRYVGVTIGPTYKYQSEPYDRAKEARRVCCKQKVKLIMSSSSQIVITLSINILVFNVLWPHVPVRIAGKFGSLAVYLCYFILAYICVWWSLTKPPNLLQWRFGAQPTIFPAVRYIVYHI